MEKLRRATRMLGSVDGLVRLKLQDGIHILGRDLGSEMIIVDRDLEAGKTVVQIERGVEEFRKDGSDVYFTDFSGKKNLDRVKKGIPVTYFEFVKEYDHTREKDNTVFFR